MPVCPKCHKLISESHYERHLKRCGTTHKHEPQSLYVPSATPQVESPNRGITYGPPSRPSKGGVKWYVVAAVVVVVVLLLVLAFT